MLQDLYTVRMRTIIMLLITMTLCHCGESTYKNPSAILKERGRHPKVHLQAMTQMDVEIGLEDDGYQSQLHKMLWVAGYTNEARFEALSRLWSIDREGTIRTIRQQLPRFTNWEWLTALCKWIAQENVVELKEGLISSWAIPTTMVKSDHERPEYLALKQLVGEDRVIDEVYETMLASNKAWQQGFRTRCWDLLHRLEQRHRLMQLLSESKIDKDDSFLIDLQRAMLELGIVPNGREEILWIRKLATPEYESFWQEAKIALQQLPAERRDRLELRDIPIAVSVNRHTPELLGVPKLQAIAHVESQLENRTHYFETEGGGGYNPSSELLSSHRDLMSWGDAMAINMILQALAVPQFREHLFDYANRDLEDMTTEYGGVIALDKQGRFEILEFEPKIRHHNRRFNASQQMFDAAYAALFHFHFHAQKTKNGDHAGPGLGDKQYANVTRANCLVFTFVDDKTLNVDFYRHDNVVVDLGTCVLKR